MTHMISSQRSPLWPYLLVLTGLFLLSLAVPKGWEQDPEPDRLRPLLRQHAQDRHRDVGGTVAILHPAADFGGAPESTALANSDGSNRWTSAGEQNSPATVDSAVAVNTSASSLISPWAETVAEKIADLRHFGMFQHLGQQNSQANNNTSNTSQNGTAGDAASTYGNPNQQQLGSLSSEQRTEALASAYWPAPKSLLAQVGHLSHDENCSAWATQVQQLCLALCQTSPGDPQQASQIVQQLQTLAQQAETLGMALKSPTAAAELRRARYALQRRLALWSLAVSNERSSSVYADVPSAEERTQRLHESLTAADTWIRSIPNADAWRSYLLLDDVARLADVNQPYSNDQARQIAQRVLARLQPEQMTDAQRQILQNSTLTTLAEQLRTWAGAGVDVHDVLANLERYEASGLPSDGRRVAVAMRQLDWSAADADRQLAKQLDEHYRNANLRIALSSALLNRLAPNQPTAKGVVNDTILGATVNGTSTTDSQLHVKLIPDPQRLHLWIEAQGTVNSETQSTSGPATFDNNGQATFLVHKAVLLDRQGVWIANAAAEADSDTQLTGFRTSYDNVPLFGIFARKMAISQHDALLGAAEQETNAKVATEADRQVNAQVKQEVDEAERAVQKDVLAPLAKLHVTPEPISLETTAQRLSLRLRIAGQNQLGGHTARPQALSDSLASVQMHESALNNILDQLQLAGQTFTLPALYRHVAEELSWKQTEPAADLPADVQVTFAAQDPVRVRCQNGTMQLTLAFDELQQGTRQWHHFLVIANYQPQIEDLHVRLVRQGAIELGGDNYKGQPELALRGAFSKLLPRERPVELVPAWIADNRNLSDMCISQCIVEDSWIALSLGPDRSDSGQQSAMSDSATLAR
jgi:hypothetical protein